MDKAQVIGDILMNVGQEAPEVLYTDKGTFLLMGIALGINLTLKDQELAAEAQEATFARDFGDLKGTDQRAVIDGFVDRSLESVRARV